MSDDRMFELLEYVWVGFVIVFSPILVPLFILGWVATKIGERIR